jgi:hypothetical protein
MAFQMRAIPKDRLKTRLRTLSAEELAELELATDGGWPSRAGGRTKPTVTSGPTLGGQRRVLVNPPLLE